MVLALLLAIVSLREDVLLRKAWEAALRTGPQSARELYPRVKDRDWVAKAGFHRIREFALTLPASDAEELLLSAARYDPSAALRQLDLDPRVLQAAALQAPAEAVGIAAGTSPSSQALLRVLPPALAALARDSALDLPTRQRLAILGDRNVADARDDRRYFARLLARKPVPREAIDFAQALVREVRQSGLRSVARWTPAERYRLAVLGREELDAPAFAKLVTTAPANPIRFRAFLNDAIQFGQLQLIRLESLPLALQGIAGEENPVEETLFAANIIDALHGEKSLAQAALLLRKDYDTAGPYQPLYGLLIAHLAARYPSNTEIAARFSPYLKAPQTLPLGPVFSHQGTSIHRYYFYDDEDGVESYQAFLASYRNASHWTVALHDNWVNITGVHGSRRIEIYANIPMKGDAEAAIRQALGNREPDVLVHRGHAFHLDKTLRRLNSTARLVFLGSCRGMESVATVIGTAPQAQMFATRGTGTHTINDPILKALNDSLLSAGEQLDWNAFWTARQGQFRGNSLFRDYIPPHQNTQAILLRAWYSYLDDTQ